MENVAKGSDGRRLFTAEFKCDQVDRILKGEVTASVTFQGAPRATSCSAAVSVVTLFDGTVVTQFEGRVSEARWV